jgi:hypothetical protein
MSLIIESILPSNQKPTTVTEETSVQAALEVMIERDYSQLLVVNQQSKLQGLITSDSILKAVSFFQVTVDQLKVSHALVKAKAYRSDEDLSELLKGLRDRNAVPIIDKQHKPVGIITSFDTTEYFRTRAEDIMLAEDVETTLRDFIEAFYKTPEGDLDEDQLNQAIETILTAGQDTEKKFQKALRQYLGQCGINSQEFDEHIAKQAFAKHLDQPMKVKGFGDLTLYEYIQLFRNVWSHYQTSFKNIDWKAIDQLLDAVRNIRNAIAHFREITPQQREQLKFCADFLDRHRPSIQVMESDTAQVAISAPPATVSAAIAHLSQFSDQVGNFVPDLWQFSQIWNGDNKVGLPEIISPAEELDSSESRYAPLAIWLQNQEQNKIILTFQDVETIIQDTLPPSARKHRNWWANDSVGHTQSQQWLEVGWRVSNVNLSEEKVTFSRIGERQIAYVNFFSALLPKLQAIPELSITSLTNHQGRHWFTFRVEAEGKPPMVNVISFARKSRLRLELYIEIGDRDRNKRIFDSLQAQQAVIESEFGEPLSWERLIGKVGARIAVYRENSSITDEPESLEDMQAWLANTLPRFYKALTNRFEAAQQATVEAS